MCVILMTVLTLSDASNYLRPTLYFEIICWSMCFLGLRTIIRTVHEFSIAAEHVAPLIKIRGLHVVQQVHSVCTYVMV